MLAVVCHQNTNISQTIVIRAGLLLGSFVLVEQLRRAAFNEGICLIIQVILPLEDAYVTSRISSAIQSHQRNHKTKEDKVTQGRRTFWIRISKLPRNKLPL